MHLFDLAGSTSVLQELSPQDDVQMRVSLSYFIGSGFGEIGWKNQYRKSSPFLKFLFKNVCRVQVGPFKVGE